MGYRIRQIETESQFCDTMTLDVLTQHIPIESIEQSLTACQAKEKRKRKLPATLLVLLCIGMNLFSHDSLGYVLLRLLRGWRLLADVDAAAVAGKGAISTARYRLGAKPLALLFKRVCRPLATPDTPGAFRFGLRLVAVDGTTETVPDTPDNDTYFGRLQGSRGPSAFPLVRCVYLCECGTHAIFDAGFWPYQTHELTGGRRLLRSVTADMLVMWDRGFHDFDMCHGVTRRGGQMLSRLPAHVKPRPVLSLPDGTWLGFIYPSDYGRRQQGERLLVRIIEYELDDPHRPGHRVHSRLITTLLHPELYPALELVCLYHERWEVELTIDEIDTHQRLVNRPLRSLKPVGVIQELYGLLLAHFLVRAVMHDAAVAHDLDPDRLSFLNSLRLIGDAVPEFQLVDPVDHPRLWQRLCRDIVAFQLPERENRTNPRVVKRKMSNFKRKRPEHWHPPQPTKSFRDAVVLLPNAPPVGVLN